MPDIMFFKLKKSKYEQENKKMLVFYSKSKITGEERYKYWNDLVKEMWEGDYPV